MQNLIAAHDVGKRWQAPGTCGELVQGAIAGRDFLVNCPIDLFSRATIRPEGQVGVRLKDGQGFGKARDAICLAMEEHGLCLHHELFVESQVPRGKGMASSTADISAALQAVSQASSKELCPRSLAKIMAAVEPSDCVNVPGIAHVNHLTGDVLDTLPVPVDMRVIIVDCGGEVSTLRFDRDRARGVYRQDEATVVRMLDLLKRGLREGNSAAVAKAATESARLSQMILHKPQFSHLLTLTRKLGALGVNCAHSGTVLGVLYKDVVGLRERLLDGVQAEFGADLEVLGDFGIIGGGCHEC